MAKAELVFIPLPGVGHLIPMLEIAKLLVHHDERISISVLIIKRPSDPKQLSFDRSLGDPTLSKRIRFIDVPYIENFSDSMTFDLFSHVESHKSSVKEVITKLFRSERKAMRLLVIDKTHPAKRPVKMELGLAVDINSNGFNGGRNKESNGGELEEASLYSKWRKLKLVFIPLPDAGHISSTLEITKLLLQHDERIAITVLVIKCSSDPKQFAFDKSLGNPAFSKRIRCQSSSHQALSIRV
ncbi:hypothetical protein ACFE04_030416 [Oxalis oulophora]